MISPPRGNSFYESYDYLSRGVDFPAVDLSDPALRRSRFDAQLDEEQAARVGRLLSQELVISFHDHPQMLPSNVADTAEYLRQSHHYTAYSELRRSGITAIFDNWFGVLGSWKWTDFITWLGTRLVDIDRQTGVVLARTVSDITDAHRDGDVAFVMGTESSTVIENDLDRIDVLYGLGLRQMGLVFAESNAVGSGQKELRDGGLTMFGRRAIERMNLLGMLIDVSHASDQTSLDAIEASSAPVAITHAGARAVWPTARMKPDEVLKACAERGGVLGIEAAPHTTVSYRHRTHSIDSVMDHFVHAVEVMGIEHVAFGPDTFYGNHVGFHNATGEAAGFSSVLQPSDLEYERVAFVDGMENPSENFLNITAWLVRHGYSDADIRAVLGGNIRRLLSEVWR